CESMPSKKTSSASGGLTRSQYSHFPTSSRTCFFVFVERAMRLRLGVLRSDAKSLVICPSLQYPAFFPGQEAGEDLPASTCPADPQATRRTSRLLHQPLGRPSPS